MGHDEAVVSRKHNNGLKDREESLSGVRKTEHKEAPDSVTHVNVVEPLSVEIIISKAFSSA